MLKRRTHWLLLALGWMSVGTVSFGAQLRLTGIAVLPQGPAALLEIKSTPGGPLLRPILKAGEGAGGIEVIKVNEAEGNILIQVAGEEQTLALEKLDPKPTARTLNLQQANLLQVLALYQEFMNRTVLRPPDLTLFSVDVQSEAGLSAAQAAEVLAKAFNAQGQVVEHRDAFTLLVPGEKADLLKAIPNPPKSPEVNPKNPPGEVFPPGLIKFQDADLGNVLAFYSELSDKMLFTARAVPAMKISVATQTYITRPQSIWCLNTLLQLGGAVVIPEGDGFAFVVPPSLAGTLPEFKPAVFQAKRSATATPVQLRLVNSNLKAVLDLYAGLTGREPLPISKETPERKLSFSARRPLSPEEAIFALEALAEMNGLQFHLLGEKQVELRLK